MSVYILHLSKPLKHAKHYIGFSEQVKRRVVHHRSGRGSKFTAACVRAGIDLVMARVFRGADRSFERNIKNQSRSRISAICPVCAALTLARLAIIRKINLLEKWS